MTPITSPQNPHLKEVRRLARRRERARSQAFVAEGEDLLAAAAAAGHEPMIALRAAGADLQPAKGVALDDAPEVDPALLAQISSLGSGTRALAVYRQRWSVPGGPLCVYLHGVRDPGNVGAVLRSALAFGASSVVLGPGCADPHGPKAVRASMGAIFAVALARAGGVTGLPGERVALVAAAGEPLRGPAPGPVTLAIGGEREGLPEAVVAACDRVAHIPIVSESLNAAMAATVAMYEMTRVGEP